MSDMTIGNKTVQYNVSVEQDGKMVPLMNTSTVQLPSWEKQSDAIKGAGIMGELNMPSAFGFAAATATFTGRVDDKTYAEMGAPGRKKFEVRWITDAFDPATGEMKMVRHRVLLMGNTTKRDLGKIEPNSAADISLEVSVFYYKSEIDGEAIEEIDILNTKFVVNGKDYAADIRSFLN